MSTEISERKIATALEFAHAMTREGFLSLPPDLKSILVTVLVECRKVYILAHERSERKRRIAERAMALKETTRPEKETTRPGTKAKAAQQGPLIIDMAEDEFA